VLIVGVAVGLAFATLDSVLNANPIAQRLYAAYKPILRESVNAPLGMALDLLFGIIMAGLFVLLAPALPGGRVTKGAIFGMLAWFFRVAMGVAAQLVMFRIPFLALLYSLATGAVEMVTLGVLCGLALPSN
jgi:uncharacterized membrane protein YagU involved in acid resistance